MTLATIIIPVGPVHWANGVYKEAVDSATQQTLACRVIVVEDTAKRGAAYARNLAAESVDTPFLVFLDADDLLHPRFVEQTLAAWRPGAYVYTWFELCQRGKPVITRKPPTELRIFDVGMQHANCTLLPTAAYRAVGGYQNVDALEDEALYMALHAQGWRAILHEASLLTYRRDRGNGRVNSHAHDQDVIQAHIESAKARAYKRYRRFFTMKQHPPKPNHVLVDPVFTPHRYVGRVTGTKYAKMGAGDRVWIDGDDYKADVVNFKLIADGPIGKSPDLETVRRLAREGLARAQRPHVEHMSTADVSADSTMQMPSARTLQRMKKAELAALASEHGVELQANATKALIIEALEERRNAYD
jgi:glycosyltransferase involved in cell wall biosynthesis